MIKVYFEIPSSKKSKLVAIFENEDTYMACFNVLEELAHKQGCIITESIDSSQDLVGDSCLFT